MELLVWVQTTWITHPIETFSLRSPPHLTPCSAVPLLNKIGELLDAGHSADRRSFFGRLDAGTLLVTPDVDTCHLAAQCGACTCEEVSFFRDAPLEVRKGVGLRIHVRLPLAKERSITCDFCTS